MLAEFFMFKGMLSLINGITSYPSKLRRTLRVALFIDYFLSGEVSFKVRAVVSFIYPGNGSNIESL